MSDETKKTEAELEHARAVGNERSERLAHAIVQAISQTGIDSMVAAHGMICFHFDDGVDCQIAFNANKGGVDISHGQETPNAESD